MIGRWEEKAKFNVIQYIEAENGPCWYRMFAKEMSADLEYEMVDVNVFQSSFHIPWMPPLKYPLRLDKPYEHDSPTGDPVISEARYRPELNDIFVETKVRDDSKKNWSALN